MTVDRPPGRKPLVWALLGHRLGDNSQVIELASRLDATVVEKRLTYTRKLYLPNRFIGASLAHLTREARALFVPPWPDLVIGIGRRSVPAARWIKQQSQGKCKLVYLGRPMTPLSVFDLVITTPQYHVPEDANVIKLPLPLAPSIMLEDDQIKKWQEEWRDLPRPLVGLAIGRPRLPLPLERQKLLLLAQRLNELVTKLTGSLLLMASPRTPPGTVNVLQQALTIPHRAYPYFDAENNPYRPALSLAEHIVVSSDSASMLADALTAGRTTYVYRWPRRKMFKTWFFKSPLGVQIMREGMVKAPRAMDLLVDELIQQGIVGELGGGPPVASYTDPAAQIISRVQALLKE